MKWVLPLLISVGLLAGAITPATSAWSRTSTVSPVRRVTLNGAQHAFAIAFSQLLLYAQDLGYTVSLGECYRTGGPKHSLHRQRLACDIQLFKNGRYLRNTEDYRYLGQWWIKYGRNAGSPLEWGGSYTRYDGNHFSYGWQGRW